MTTPADYVIAHNAGRHEKRRVAKCSLCTPAPGSPNGDPLTPTARRRGRPSKAVPSLPSLPIEPSAGDGLFGALYHAHRQREDYLSLEQVFATRISAATRRDPELAPLVIGDFDAHVKQLRKARKQWEKTLVLLAVKLPVAGWIAKDVRGISLLGLAQVIAETGDLGTYANPAKVWKRMGLAVINGEAQGRRRGQAGIEHGFSPRRRKIMWNLADGLVKQNRGEMRAYYETEKARQALKLPDAAPFIVDGRARRHLAKRFLRELWRVWRDSVEPGRAHDPVTTGLSLPAPSAPPPKTRGKTSPLVKPGITLSRARRAS